MGQGLGTPVKQNKLWTHIHEQLMKQGGIDYDIGTATTVTYDQFLEYIQRLNRLCSNYKDEDGNILMFAVKKDSDSKILLWKATVQVACVKFNTVTENIESHRMLNLRQFLQIFRRITCEYDEAHGENIVGEDLRSSDPDPQSSPSSPPCQSSSDINEIKRNNGATSSTSNGNSHKIDLINQTIQMFETKDTNKAQMGTSGPCNATNLEECIICLERKPDVILPCSHAYCTPCIEQWWEYRQLALEELCPMASTSSNSDDGEKNCPVCRQALSEQDDTWVIPEIPDQADVSRQIRKSLVSLASNKQS